MVNGSENAQKAKNILNQAIAALGGPAYLGVQDISEAGRTYGFQHGQPADAGVLYWRFWKFPASERVELTKQRDVIYIFVNGQGYERTFKGTRLMDPKQNADYKRQSEMSLSNILRRWFGSPDVALFYDARTFAGNNPADQVSLMNSHNQGVTLYLDAATHLPVKKSFVMRDPDSGDRDTYEETYANYHLVQGVQTPYDITRTRNGDMVRQRFLNKATYNSGLADSLFAATPTYDPTAKKK